MRLCDQEKDLHEPFLRRVRGLELAKEARGKVKGSRRARSKKWERVTRSGGRIGVDDRQPVITLQENLCIFSTEVMWVGGKKGNQPGEA